jgi:hypothetical protein
VKTEVAASEHPAVPVQGTGNADIPHDLGAVFFTSEPSGAEVYVDDALMGKSPITLNLKIGHH